MNNIDAPAFIYENIAPNESATHYLHVRVEGEAPNRRGIGAKLILTAGGQKQHLYATPYRGFMSTMDDRLHFGLGRAARVDSLEVVWPDGRYQLLTGLDVDRLVILKQTDATGRNALLVRHSPHTISSAGRRARRRTHHVARCWKTLQPLCIHGSDSVLPRGGRCQRRQPR